MRKDLTKENLYEGVKLLVDTEEQNPHAILRQAKLFTLASIGFQYLLFAAQKKAGAYIVRFENPYLAEKVAFKAKDPTTRKFLSSLLLPRRLKYKSSTFYLDYFNLSSWNLTNEIPQDKFRMALMIEDSHKRPLLDEVSILDESFSSLPENYHYTSLKELCPRTLYISTKQNELNVPFLEFPFIKGEKEDLPHCKISKEISLEDFDD